MRGDPSRWRLHVEQVGPVTVARLTHLEDLWEAEIQTLGDRLLRLVDAGSRQIVLDLNGITDLTSSMLGKIVALYKRTRQEGGRLALCGVSARLRESLEALQLTRLFQTFEDRHKAVAALTPDQ